MLIDDDFLFYWLVERNNFVGVR